MKVTVSNDELKKLILTGKSVKYKKVSKNQTLLKGLLRAINIMQSETCCEHLKLYSFLHYEKLKYRNQSSVRIANGYIERLIFTEHSDGIEVNVIELDDTHYGNK